MTDDAFDTNVEGLKAALADRYVIERELGRGGMATVFLAHDVRHDRKVALKLLKPELGAIVGGDRFLAEIRTTANLQHPHILALFDSGEVDGQLFYVMPHIEGESLRQRIDREKQLSIAEAIRLTDRIADALDYAHEHGVVHRDIKPANILVTERGEPLVADFGIALAVSEAGGGRITETGLSLGTPHYMSPEQATGDRDIDPRSDIYSLGCMLYEMLAGQPPFAAPTAQGVLVRILTEHPRSVSDFRHTVPTHVVSVLARALEKLPADRFETAAEFKTALADEGFRYTTVPQPTEPTPPASEPLSAPVGASSEEVAGPSGRVVGVLGGALALALIAAGVGWFRPGPPPPPTMHAAVDLDDLQMPNIANRIVISPDGSKLAVATGGFNAEGMLHLRNSDEPDFRPVPGTDGAHYAVFSPDSEWLVYATGDALVKVSVDGGAPQPVLQPGVIPNPSFPFWTDDGWIVFNSRGGGVYRVRDSGGAPDTLLNGVIATTPRALPGGTKFIFNQMSAPFINSESEGVRLYDLETDSTTVLVPEGFDPMYVEGTGHLLWIDLANALWAAPFDPDRGEITGDHSLVVDGVSSFRPLFGRYSISNDGTLVYSSGAEARFSASRQFNLVVAGLDGAASTVELDPRYMTGPRWSPNGRRVAYGGASAGSSETATDIWVYDIELEARPRSLTSHGDARLPIWSPDGTRIAYTTSGEGGSKRGQRDLWIREVDSDAPPTRLLSLPGPQSPMDWPNDSTLVFEDFGPPGGAAEGGVRTGYGIFIAELGDSVTVRPYYGPEADIGGLRVSPDGTLAAYDSDESGQREIYIRSFPEPRAETLISGGGGRSPFWSPDGSTLYYRSLRGDSIYAARLQLEPALTVLSRDAILEWPYAAFGQDLHPDGDRFIALEEVVEPETGEAEAPAAERHFVVTNWFEELRSRTGGAGDGR